MLFDNDKLEDLLECTFAELATSPDDCVTMRAFLAPLKHKNTVTHFHYQHSLRVGFLSRSIARFVHLDDKAVFYAGLLHDLGKCLVALQTLGRTDDWTSRDTKEVKPHVMNGYKLLRGRFDFTAEVILWHHRFQREGYPKRLPPPLHEYSHGTKLLIAECGRMVAIADVYDALHRENSKFGERRVLSGQEIKEKMVQFNPDRKQLIHDLYATAILTA